ncbi:MAG: SynChlorMet cassette protein ScmD [Acidobacteriota bacterium]
MNQTDRPVANPLVVLREEFDDWAVLFNPDTADAVGINPLGVALWKTIDGTRTVAQLVSQVRAGFADVPASADAEIAAYLDDLIGKGFVGCEPAPAA